MKKGSNGSLGDNRAFSFLRRLLKEPQRFIYHFTAVSVFPLFWQRWVSKHMEHTVSPQYPVYAEPFRDFGKIGDLDNRYTRPLDLFCHHCAAA